jgi:hypothetical protein
MEATMEEALKMQNNNGHGLDPRFIKNLKGKDFVLYAGVLDVAHQIGLKSIHVEAVQYPNKDNGSEGICKATVVASDGREFSEVGDANPKNVTPQIAVHVLRMAATRAKARALRDFTNIGMTCLEELGNTDDVIPSDTSNVLPMRKQKQRRSTNETDKPETPPKDQNPDPTKTPVEKAKEKPTGATISTAQRNAIMSLCSRKSITEQELENLIEDAYKSTLDNLTTSEASSLIRSLQQAA